MDDDELQSQPELAAARLEAAGGALEGVVDHGTLLEPVKSRPHSEVHAQKPAASANVNIGPGAGDLIRAVFLDERKKPCAHVRVATPHPHLETISLGSGRMRHALEGAWFDAHTVLPDEKWVRAELRRLRFLASRSGPRPLSARFASDGEFCWLDLADDHGRAVRVGPQGWQVVADPPPLFPRFEHQLPLPVPEPGGRVADLLDYLPPLSAGERLLFLVWMVLAPLPAIDHPILLPWGDPGSGKSMLTKLARALLDPSRVPLLGDDDRRDLMVTFTRHAVVAFDNLGNLKPREADLVCRAVTGGGTSRRKLFSDDDEVVLAFHRPIIMNGVTLPSFRSDFLDRALLLHLSRLETHRAAGELDSAFRAARPRILGGLLDVLAATLAQREQLPPGKSFRMADFAAWGRAAAVALGRTAGEFDAAYGAAVTAQVREVVASDIVALAVQEYMRDKHTMVIDGKDWFPQLKAIADSLRHEAEWPTAGSGALSKHIDKIKPTLREIGIIVEKLTLTGTVRSRWKITRVVPTNLH